MRAKISTRVLSLESLSTNYGNRIVHPDICERSCTIFLQSEFLNMLLLANNYYIFDTYYLTQLVGNEVRCQVL